jgi:hypothetical protein
MKYIYKFCVYKNNARDGVQFVRAFDSLPGALSYQWYLQMHAGGGCCDVVKKRFLPGSSTPLNNTIYNNYKYSDYDL